MIAALLALLTVWTTQKGDPIYVAHCRAQPRGCAAHLESTVGFAIAAADAWEIDPHLLIAVAFVESGLNPALLGKVGELGMWQLHPKGAGARARAYEGPGRPRTYAEAFMAAQELHRGLERCGTLEGALAYFHTGHPRRAGGRCLAGGAYASRVARILESTVAAP